MCYFDASVLKIKASQLLLELIESTSIHGK